MEPLQEYYTFTFKYKCHNKNIYYCHHCDFMTPRHLNMQLHCQCYKHTSHIEMLQHNPGARGSFDPDMFLDTFQRKLKSKTRKEYKII